MVMSRVNGYRRPYGQQEAVLRALQDGPGTSGEIALALGWSTQLASATLTNLAKKRRIVAEKFAGSTSPLGGRRPSRIYRLQEAA
jgi:predicted ArsR family transcriptional regulator